MSGDIENKLIEEFKSHEVFSRDELLEFYRFFEPDLKEGTFGWRIHDLKQKNIIQLVRRGHYTISSNPKYKPEPSDELLKIAKLISERFEDVKHCVWETDWLNEFSQHQTSKRMVLIEIEKEFVESLYYEIKDSFDQDVFLNPDRKTIDFYVAESNRPVVIRNLITRSPLSEQTEKKIRFFTPQLEKILVDIFAEHKLFYFYQGGELIHIYQNALERYTLNFTTLFSYAKRREREQEIKLFLNSHLGHLVKDYIE